MKLPNSLFDYIYPNHNKSNECPDCGSIDFNPFCNECVCNICGETTMTDEYSIPICDKCDKEMGLTEELEINPDDLPF